MTQNQDDQTNHKGFVSLEDPADMYFVLDTMKASTHANAGSESSGSRVRYQQRRSIASRFGTPAKLALVTAGYLLALETIGLVLRLGILPFRTIDSSVWTMWSVRWFGNIFIRAILAISALMELIPLPSYLSAFSITLIIVALINKAISYPFERITKRNLRLQAQAEHEGKRLEQIYGEDKQKLAEAKMKVYREVGYNPVSGCLPVIAQLTLFAGLWSAVIEMIRRSVQLDTHMLWMGSMTSCEPNRLCNPTYAVFAYPVPILTLIYIVATWDVSRPRWPVSNNQVSPTVMVHMQNAFTFLFSLSLATMPAAIVFYLLLRRLLDLLTNWIEVNIFSSTSRQIGRRDSQTLPNTGLKRRRKRRR